MTLILPGKYLMHLLALSGICLGIALYEGRVRDDLPGRRLAAFSAAASWVAAMTVCWTLWCQTLVLREQLDTVLQESAEIEAPFMMRSLKGTQHAKAR